MSKLVNIALRWIIQNFLSFALIIFILVVGNEINHQYKDYLRLPNPDKSWDIGLSNLESQLKDNQNKIKKDYESVFLKLTRTKPALEKRRVEISKKKSEINKKSPIEISVCLFGSFDQCSDAIRNKTKDEIEIGLLSQEDRFIGGLILEINDRASSVRNIEEQRKRLDNSYHKAVRADNKYAACEVAFKAKSTFERGWDKFWKKGCQSDFDLKNKARMDNQNEFEKFNKISEQKTRSLTIEQKFEDVESNILRELKEGISKYREKHENHIFSKISKKFENQFLTAALILIGAISTPILIKLFFFYIVAPFAAKRPAISLMKFSSGVIEKLPEPKSENTHGVTISELTTSILVIENEELLIKDEYISDLAMDGNRKTRFLFSHSFPITSLASGLYALTQIRTDSTEVVNIQATHESLYEVGVLIIPEGTALVLKPHKLIGIVQDKNHPIKITRHWRLGSLHAWLTLQLRYMVFHGPGKLILKGCKGIQVARANSGRAINQSATIGFTANVDYSNSRTETFFPYLNGKKELFNDSFNGDSGYYIYETMPYADKKGGLFGRGIEGLTDSVLKVFGV